jgi:ATP-dependent Lon protease
VIAVSDEKKEPRRGWLGRALRALRSSSPFARAAPPAAALRGEELPEVLAVLPLRNAVFFPGGQLPMAIGRRKTARLIREAVRDHEVIGVVSQRSAEVADPRLADLYPVGTVARVVKLLKMGEDGYSMVMQGLARFRVLELAQEIPYLRARVGPLEDRLPSGVAEVAKVRALGLQLREAAREVFGLMPQLPPAVVDLLRLVERPGDLANMVAANVSAPQEEVQAVLEATDVEARIRLVQELLVRKRALLRSGANGDQPKLLRLVPSPEDP